jgi:hypothetical protein
MSDVIEPSVVEEIKTLTTLTQVGMKDLAVVDKETLVEAIAFGREVKFRAARIEARLDKILKPLNESRNSLLELKRSSLAPFMAWDKEIKTACIAYNTKREEEAAESKRKADAEALKLAEDSRLAHAAQVEQTQGRDAATVLLDQPVIPVPTQKSAEPPKTAGAMFTTRWKHEVVDPALVPREWLMVDDRALAAYATSRKDQAVVPGVRFYPDKGMGLKS